MTFLGKSLIVFSVNNNSNSVGGDLHHVKFSELTFALWRYLLHIGFLRERRFWFSSVIIFP